MRRNFDAVDARAEDVFRGSVLHRLADGVLRRGRAAWQSSMIHRLAPVGSTGQLRFIATATLVAALTALLMTPLGTTPRRLAWLVPVVAAMAGVLLLMAAPRAARSDNGTR